MLKDKEKDKRKKFKEVVLSHQEIEMLRFIHEFGFCEIRHIMKRFDLGKSSAYQYMNVLIRLGLILHFQIRLNHPGVYYLTSKTIRLLDLDLPALDRIPLNVYVHHMTVINVHLKCRERFSNAVWISERRLIQDKYSNAGKCQNHLPDGALFFPDGTQYAIEVERSLKSRKRIEAILIEYGLQRRFKEVWYFGSRQIMSVVKEMASTLSYIKIFEIEEFLNG